MFDHHKGQCNSLFFSKYERKAEQVIDVEHLRRKDLAQFAYNY